MRAFAGLGYYSRARNMHACAIEIAKRGGVFPTTEADLRALPGIGAYTAAAVAAIAFDEPAAPVDGNIAAHIVARIEAIEQPIVKDRGAIAKAAAALDAGGAARRFRTGVDGSRRDDLHAAQSRLVRTRPLEQALARAAAAGDPEAYPRKAPRKPRPHRRGKRPVLRGRRPTWRAALLRTRPAEGAARLRPSNCPARLGRRTSPPTRRRAARRSRRPGG